MSGASIFQMISGIGDSFSKSYDAAKKDGLSSDLGEKLRTGDFAGAADVALRGGDLKTGLELMKMGETRGASKQLGETLGGLFGGGGDGATQGVPGTLGTLGEAYRAGSGRSPTRSESSLPSFAGGGGAPMRVPGSGGEIETRFVDALKTGGLTNPYGLAAMAAYAGRESGYKPSNITGSWSDPSESGQAGTSGGILSWRGDRFANMRRLTAGAKDPVAAQASFALTENPELTLALQSAKSPEEANQLMANAWRFAGFNRPGGEFAARLGSTRQYLARLGGTPTADPAPTQVASAEPDAANMPARGAMTMGFQIPDGQSQEPAGLGRPGPNNTALSEVGASGASTAEMLPGGSASASGGAPAATGPTLPPSLQTASALAQARLPTGTAGPILRAAPGSSQRVQALVRASLIPGLSEQQLSTVRTLLSSEIEQSKLTGDQRDYALAQSQGFGGTFIEFKNALSGQRDEGAKINLQVTAREREVRARGLDPNEPANRRYIFTGSMPEDRSRSQVVEARDGQRYVVNPDDPSADPRRLNIPSAGIRLWGSTGPDGQVVQPPPNVPPGTAGYFDEKGEPQLIVGKGVNVTTNVGAGETEEAKKLGGLRGERAASIESAGMKAPEQIAKLNLLERSLQGVRTGTLGPAESTVVGFAQSLGIPNETISGLGLNPRQAIDAQTATKLINESIVGMIGAGGFPANNFSNADREFLTDIFPKISNRPEANQTAIEVLRRIQGRNLEVADAWAEYQQAQREARKPLSVQEFEFNFRKAQRDKPDLFADLRQQADAAPAGRGGEGGAGGGSPPPAFDPRTSKISMEDGKALTSAPDTAENRRLFDERYGAGAADFVFRDRSPQGGQQSTTATTDAPKTIARGSSRQTMPRGYTSDRALFDARQAIRDGRDRGVIEDRLRAYGIDPAALDR